MLPSDDLHSQSKWPKPMFLFVEAAQPDSVQQHGWPAVASAAKSLIPGQGPL